MFGAVVYQRRTGPTYPARGELTIAGTAYPYELIRSEETVRNAVVKLPDPEGQLEGVLRWRRYPTDEPWTDVPLSRDPASVRQTRPDDEWKRFRKQLDGHSFAALPRMPAAGKVEYHLVVQTPEGEVRIPGVGEADIVLRYKDPVPAGVLAPHVICMFLAVVVGLRAGLGALAQPRTMRRYAWVTMLLLTAGGMALGPIVQKHAFGAYWTGFPWGYDLTDNKMLIMWLAWLAGCIVAGRRAGRREGLRRLVLVLATLVMVAVYLIPHSMRGSELDYSQLEQGVDPKEAIGTGDR
jgi:hypothetical protein